MIAGYSGGARLQGFIRPKVVASKCLGFAPCRWNAQIISNDFVKLLGKHADFQTVCPEVEIGLGIPRNPIRVIDNHGKLALYQPATGKDFTKPMEDFCESYLKNIEGIDGFILKGSSPSCGIKNVKVYSGFENPSVKEKGSGFFGKAVVDRFPDLAVEDEERLANVLIREHFLTKLFTLAKFRHVRMLRDPAELVNFHSDNKLLLMAFSQEKLRELGHIVANQKKVGIEMALKFYSESLAAAISRPPKKGSMVNALMHIFGYFSEKLSSQEKKFFMETIDSYRLGKMPLIVSINLTRSLVTRFGIDYLLRQTILEPYPADLLSFPTYDEDRDYWHF